jgi:hypothetical protein
MEGAEYMYQPQRAKSGLRNKIRRSGRECIEENND